MRELALTIKISFIYLISLYTSIFFFPSFDLVLSSDDLQFDIGFCYIPFGVRVVWSWLFAWRSVLHLLPGTLAGDAVVFIIFFKLDYFLVGTFIGLSMVCLPIIFSACSRIGYELRYPILSNFAWLKIMLVGSSASLLSAFLLTILFKIDLKNTLLLAASQITGTVLIFIMLMLFFRFFHRQMSGDNPPILLNEICKDK